MDELADRLGIDPIDLRLQNCLRPGDETPHGQRLGDDVALAECLEEVRRRPTGTASGASTAQQAGGRRRGRRAAAGDRRGLLLPRHVAGRRRGRFRRQHAARSTTINSLTLTSGLTDYGTGSRTVYTLIAAEMLGLQSRAHPHAPRPTPTRPSPAAPPWPRAPRCWAATPCAWPPSGWTACCSRRRRTCSAAARPRCCATASATSAPARSRPPSRRWSSMPRTAWA